MTRTIDDLKKHVQDCYLDYSAQGIQIGDPSYEWEDAHHPDPACLGGTKTVPLMKKDHAVHGVLQSEVFQHPCIYGWEANYLEGELYDLCKKWHSEKSKVCGKMSTPAMQEARRQNGERVGKNYGSIGGGKKSQLQMQAWSNTGSTTKREQKGIFDPVNKEVVKEGQRKGRENGACSNGGKVGSKTTNSQRWMCTVTGYISTPAGLSKYQRVRGIDTSNRIKIEQ